MTQSSVLHTAFNTLIAKEQNVVMGVYDKEVIQIITQPVWDEILDRVAANWISETQMDDFAKEVSPENPNVSGNHLRRMNRNAASDKNEMRAIFNDWFHASLYDMNTTEAKSFLKEVFKKIDVVPLDSLQECQTENPESRDDETRATDDDTTYRMTNFKKAIILNQKTFDKGGERDGTDKDRDELEKVLRTLGFEVETKDSPNVKAVSNCLEKAAAETDGTKTDCLFVVALTHGSRHLLSAKDGSYPEEKLWEPFLADKCKGLAQKPKIFIIQACRGDQKDRGAEVDKDGEEADEEYAADGVIIPTHGDVLIARSSVEGYESLRHKTDGSIFIQQLCMVLDANAKLADPDDFVSVLAKVNNNVGKQTMLHDGERTKQTPCFFSTLTKKVKLTMNKE